MSSNEVDDENSLAEFQGWVEEESAVFSTLFPLLF